MAKNDGAAPASRTKLTVGIVAIVCLAIVAVVAVTAARRNSTRAKADQALALAAKRPVADFGARTADAGCTDETTQTPGADWNKHVVGKVDYDAAPPAGGRHNSVTLPMPAARFYSRAQQPVIERAVHDMEHGLVVAWYDKALPDAEVSALKQVAAAAGDKNLRMVAVPWDRAAFADGRHFVLTSWGVTRRCTRVSGEVVAAFVKAHADSTAAPEHNFRV